MTHKIDKKPIASNNRKHTAARPRFWMAIASVLCIASLAAPLCYAQTAATGAINGTVTDPSHAVVTGASIKVTSQATGETRTAATSANGSYTVPLLPPGLYTIAVSAQGFKSAAHPAVLVNVTETAAVNFQLEVGAATQTVTVQGNAAQLNTENSSLGQVVSQREVVGLPLVTRNYTQIIALSPGVTSDANNANQLGRGTGGEDPQFFAHGGTYAHGVPSNDNNFQMNGVPIDDLEETGTFSGGIAIPNPDTIEQFRVQTGQYDATFGNGAGANVDLITRGGTNQFHGTLFEFFRNDALNANDFFANRSGAKRPVLRQNQFGGTVGGPIVRNKAFFFGSYQGTRQANAIAAGCSLSVITPPFTNDRSREALGALFGGQTGLFGGVAVAPDGSNINPIALTLLQKKLSNGQYLIPTPQIVAGGVGSSFFSDACHFNEDQYMANGDYNPSNKSMFSVRFFQAKSNETSTFPIGEISALPGIQPETFRNFSFAHTYVFGPTAVNEARFGYHRTSSLQTTPTSFTFSSLGAIAPPQDDTQPVFELPGLTITGGAGPTGWSQNHLTFEDTFSLTKGKHDMSFGAGTRRAAVNTVNFNDQAGPFFLSYPDFLLGLSAAQNGSFFSNVFGAFDFLGFPQRDFKVWDRWAFAQDNIRLTPALTVNLGLRYEKIGEFYDSLGRNSNLDQGLLNPTPPASGTLAGYVVPSNYSGGAIPAGVTKLDNGFGIKGAGQNKVSPRVGFAWQVRPQSTVVRGGYGLYFTRPNGQVLLQLSQNLPFSIFRFVTGFQSASATLQDPFPHPLLAPSDFPLFLPYSPSTQLTTTSLQQNYQPAWVQEFGLNVQQSFGKDWTGEIGYVGTRFTHLPDTHGINQAALASPGNPIRGVTTNTLANISQRSPFLGWSTPGLLTIDSEAYGWYNGLETSLSKQFSHGLQLLASYTFSKDTASNGANATESGQGIGDSGNQNDPQSRYGPTDFNRKHRFVLSFLYQFPSLNGDHAIDRTLLNGWSVSGTALFQSGQSLSLVGTNGNNIFGITNDRAQFAPGCTAANLAAPGSVHKKLGDYFNNSCIDGLVATGSPQWTPLDGGTNFGDSGVGIVEGPGQHNVDLAFIKNTNLHWPNDVSNLEFRAEMFNAFNSPQFANPDTNSSDFTFGQISSTSVNARIVQFALKLRF